MTRRWILWRLKKAQADADLEQEQVDPIEENSPDWYLAVMSHLVEAYAPTINFKNLFQCRPSQSMPLTFGEFIGHEYVAWHQNSPGLAAACDQIPDEYTVGC